MLLAVIPAFSLAMACLYYSVFFSNFEGLELNILTLADYFNKSIEFLSLAFFVLFSLMFAIFLYPPKHKGETDDEHYVRIGGSEKIYGKMDKFFNLIVLSMPIVLIVSLFTATKYAFLMLIPTFFIFWILVFALNMAKHFPSNLREILYTKVNLFIFIAIFMGILRVSQSALTDAENLSAIDNDQPMLIDVIDIGYLQKQKSNIVLFDKSWSEIATYPIQEPSTEVAACSFGLKFWCEKSAGE